MNTIEQEELIEKINDAIRGANSYEYLRSFFNTDKRIKSFYDKISIKLTNEGCFSTGIIMVYTIKELLDQLKIREYEEEDEE